MNKTPPPAEVKRSGKKPDAPAPKPDPSMNGGARGGDPEAEPKPKTKVEPPIIERNVT